MTRHEHIAQLLFKRSLGTLTDEESAELELWTRESPGNQALYNDLDDDQSLATKLSDYNEQNKQQLRDRIYSSIKKHTPVRRMNTGWMRYAAAIIIAIGIGTIIYLNNHTVKPVVTQSHSPGQQNDITPGGDKAVLTLGDGRQIVLEEAITGELAKEDNTTILKTKEGEVVYKNALTSHNSQLPTEESALTNTLTTPRGGQYQLTLPDGTKVWLNAESSITYPAAFTGNDRKVSVTGEAYFEVSRDKTKPFRVTTADQTIEVLGTKFNVNAYADEPAISTTLIEGSIRLKVHDARSTNNNTTVLILEPGQQGRLRDRQLSLAANPDVEQSVAWKNGAFNFNNLKLEEVMRQIARWYDVQIVYEAQVPLTKFGGKMGRDLKLSQVLKLLAEMGIKFRIEGRKLIVQ